MLRVTRLTRLCRPQIVPVRTGTVWHFESVDAIGIAIEGPAVRVRQSAVEALYFNPHFGDFDGRIIRIGVPIDVAAEDSNKDGAIALCEFG